MAHVSGKRQTTRIHTCTLDVKREDCLMSLGVLLIEHHAPLKMLFRHHTIQYQSIYASGGFYSGPFALEHGDNRSTKLCLGTYLPILLHFL